MEGISERSDIDESESSDIERAANEFRKLQKTADTPSKISTSSSRLSLPRKAHREKREAIDGSPVHLTLGQAIIEEAMSSIEGASN